MSTELPQVPQSPLQPAQAAQQAKGLFSRFGALLKKIWKRVPKHLGLPAGIALLTFVFLIAIVAIVWSVFLNDPVHVPWRHWMTTTRIVIIAALVFVIPLVVYRTLKLWIEGDASPYSDIEFAWKAGMQALSDNGMSIESIPVFLILGSTDLEREQSIIDASHQGFRVRGVPEGPAPLHWYANPDGVYIYCSDVGCSSLIADRIEKQHPASNPDSMEPVHVDAVSTTNANQHAAESQEVQNSVEPQESELSGVTSTPGLTDRELQPVVLAAGESARQLERLRYVCHLLRRARRPFCPINGIVCLIPFCALDSSSSSVGEFSKSIRTDLAELQASLQFRCPTMAVFVGMEQEAGFRELVRRYGRDQAISGVFGVPHDVRIRATFNELSVFSGHIVGAFENSIYGLFRDETALSRPGNTHLFSLLCKIRFQFRDRLSELLVRGFGFPSDSSKTKGTSALFGGCYFTATGTRPDRQAFVQGVLGKLVVEQESVQWNRRALKSNRRLNICGLFGFGISVALLVLLAAQVVWKLM
jgi:hypothetical protein